MFRVRYETRAENGELVDNEVVLDPAPTDVDYPAARSVTEQATVDGKIVLHRPLKDGRKRKWIWRNYPASHAAYEDQWKLLESLNAGVRWENNLPPTVGIWEDVSGMGGFNKVDENGARVFTTVKFTQVDRKVRRGGGIVIYDPSEVHIFIEDENYDYF